MINVQLDTVANSIAALEINGINIVDIDDIPESAMMQTPLLLPQPNGFVSDIAPEFRTYGSGGAAKIDLQYTLNYLYLHAPTGSGISTFDAYKGLLENIILIFESIFASDVVSGAIDLQLSTMSDIGTVQDPSGNDYWGIQFSLRILEHVQ